MPSHGLDHTLSREIIPRSMSRINVQCGPLARCQVDQQVRKGSLRAGKATRDGDVYKGLQDNRYRCGFLVKKRVETGENKRRQNRRKINER